MPKSEKKMKTMSKNIAAAAIGGGGGGGGGGSYYGDQ